MTFTGIPVPYHSRDEWLKLRREGIGGSDVAAVVGLSPWNTPFGVWADKTGALDDIDESEPMLWGRLLEDAVMDEWGRRSGLSTIHRGGLFRRVDEPWMMCTVDGLAVPRGSTELADVEAVVEVKLDSSKGWPDGPPAHYVCQVQWQMAVLGVSTAHVVVLHQGRRLDVHTVAADPEDQTALIDAARSFWFDHVEAGVAPPVAADDNRLLGQVWPDDGDGEVEVDGELVAELADVRRRLDELSRRRDWLEAQIKDRLREAQVGTVDGVRAVSWRAQTRRIIDTRRLKAERPDIAEQYTSERTTRVFRLHWKQEETDG